MTRQQLLEKIISLWHNRHAVCVELENQAWREGYTGDSDDQVDMARTFGVLAGQSETPEACVGDFYDILVNEYSIEV